MSPADTLEQTMAPDAGLTPAETRHFGALEKRIERGLQTFREVGQALMDIRDQRLYRNAHKTFEDYCVSRWQMGRDRAYQLIGAAEVATILGDDALTNEAQARELVPLLHDKGEEEVKVIWQRVRDTGQPITAPLIRQEARAGNGQAAVEVTPPSATERLASEVIRLVTNYTRWVATKPSRKERSIVDAALRKLDEATG